MNNEERLDEQAIRAQVDAALNKMPRPAPDADGGGRRRERERDEADPHLKQGTVTGIRDRDVFVDLGPRVQGVISIEEFEEPPQVGQSFEFGLVSIQDGLWTLSRKEARALATWKDLDKGRQVKATVIGENSGGLELKIGPVSAFMPASEIAVGRVEDFRQFVGQTWVCEVMEVDRRKKRVVLSRKAVLLRERKESRVRTMESLAPGQVVRGTVEKLEAFGAFVDIGGGVTGLLHVSNISHQRVADPATVLAVGQPVEVQILEIKEGGRRIGLGMKQLAVDPWEGIAERWRVGQTSKGKIVRVAEFGAFVELEPAVEGLLHKSQLSPERVRTVNDAVKVGEEVLVRVLEVDRNKRRISLSRMNERGAMIGSDEDLGSEDLNAHLSRATAPTCGTNLGKLLQEALDRASKQRR